MIRTALINTATNMRDRSGAAKANGLTADSIIAQGGGLVDVYEAVNAKALMGVSGDGVSAPRILGSHSYGEVPVINSRMTHTSPINVTIRDLSGQGGTYNLGVANNRDLQLAGINVSTSQSSVNVPAGRRSHVYRERDRRWQCVTRCDGGEDKRYAVVFEKIQMQWFVTAQRSDGGEVVAHAVFLPSRSLACRRRRQS